MSGPHDPAFADSGEQESNVVPDQIHLVLTPEELVTIVRALRASELQGLADRLDAVVQRVGQSPQA